MSSDVPRRFFDYDEHRRQIEADLAEKPEPEPEAPPEAKPPLVVRPGSQWAAAAYKQGREDEWINAMQARYGDLYD